LRDATRNAGLAAPQAHQLRNSWVFWFRPPISKANGFIEYEKTLHPIAALETVENFFKAYQHLKRPSTLPLVSDYHLFKKGIRPIWEDEENKKGGKWVMRLRKGVADRYWEDLLFAIIGEQFGEASEEVCGVVLSVRNGEDILSIWARSSGQRVLKIRYAPLVERRKLPWFVLLTSPLVKRCDESCHSHQTPSSNGRATIQAFNSARRSRSRGARRRPITIMATSVRRTSSSSSSNSTSSRRRIRRTPPTHNSQPMKGGTGPLMTT
jgi:hypothetical protein